MMKQASLIGLMVVLGAVPLATVNAFVDNGCTLDDNIHYYLHPGGFTIWESKKDGLVVVGVGAGIVFDTCTDPVDGTDNDFESGSAARLQVLNVPTCGPWNAHHVLDYYVHDLVIPDRDIVTGDTGADGTLPCGDGLITPDLDLLDCLAPFWGKGPHTACGVGADGSYWVFINAVTVDLNEPRVGASTTGCIWTTNYGNKDVKSQCIKS